MGEIGGELRMLVQHARLANIRALRRTLKSGNDLMRCARRDPRVALPAMQTPALRKLLKSIGFDEVAEREGHVLLRSDKKQVVLPIGEALKPTTLRRFET